MEHKYIKLVHHVEEHKDWFVVNWCLGNTCNYSCSYCPKNLHNGTIPWPDEEKVKRFIDRVMDQASPRKVYFEFTGGEVTLNPHFIEICKYVTERGAKVGLISNGSRTLRWWEENKQYFDHVCLSFHPEHADGYHFIDVIKTLHKDVRVHVNVMMSPERFKLCCLVANAVKKISDISLAIQPLIHDFGDTLYTYTPIQQKVFENQYQLFLKHIKHTRNHTTYRGAMRAVDEYGKFDVFGAHRFISDKTNDWSGWKCYAGVEQIIVDLGGKIYRGWCRQGGLIGTINDEDLKLPVEPVICNKTMCHCNFDIMSTKERE